MADPARFERATCRLGGGCSQSVPAALTCLFSIIAGFRSFRIWLLSGYNLSFWMRAGAHCTASEPIICSAILFPTSLIRSVWSV